MGLAGEVPVKPRIFLASWFGLFAVVWVLVPTGFARGIVFGAAVAPVVIVGSLLIYTGFGRSAPSKPFPARVPIRSWDYELEAVAVDGSRLHGSGLRGRIAVVSYWPASEAPDLKEVAGLARLRAATEDLPVDVLCVVEKTEGELTEMLEEHRGIGVPVFRFEGKPPTDYRNLPMGMTFVVGPTGVIVAQAASAGIWDDESVIAFVRALATGANSD